METGPQGNVGRPEGRISRPPGTDSRPEGVRSGSPGTALAPTIIFASSLVAGKVTAHELTPSSKQAALRCGRAAPEGNFHDRSLILRGMDRYTQFGLRGDADETFRRAVRAAAGPETPPLAPQASAAQPAPEPASPEPAKP
jgi:hypothetical protein